MKIDFRKIDFRQGKYWFPLVLFVPIVAIAYFSCQMFTGKATDTGVVTDSINTTMPEPEGYGLHMEAIDRIKEDGGEFIVTVDCGSSSADETAYAHSLGIGTLVTDHHNMSGQRADGLIINPRMAEDTYPFKGLAGVGVAYKLALAISRERDIPGPLMAELLEFATVGTIADSGRGIEDFFVASIVLNVDLKRQHLI